MKNSRLLPAITVVVAGAIMGVWIMMSVNSMFKPSQHLSSLDLLAQGCANLYTEYCYSQSSEEEELLGKAIKGKMMAKKEKSGSTKVALVVAAYSHMELAIKSTKKKRGQHFLLAQEYLRQYWGLREKEGD